MAGKSRRESQVLAVASYHALRVELSDQYVLNERGRIACFCSGRNRGIVGVISRYQEESCRAVLSRMFVNHNETVARRCESVSTLAPNAIKRSFVLRMFKAHPFFRRGSSVVKTRMRSKCCFVGANALVQDYLLRLPSAVFAVTIGIFSVRWLTGFSKLPDFQVGLPLPFVSTAMDRESREGELTEGRGTKINIVSARRMQALFGFVVVVTALERSTQSSYSLAVFTTCMARAVSSTKMTVFVRTPRKEGETEAFSTDVDARFACINQVFRFSQNEYKGFSSIENARAARRFELENEIWGPVDVEEKAHGGAFTQGELKAHLCSPECLLPHVSVPLNDCTVKEQVKVSFEHSDSESEKVLGIRCFPPRLSAQSSGPRIWMVSRSVSAYAPPIASLVSLVRAKVCLFFSLYSLRVPAALHQPFRDGFHPSAPLDRP
ncbi:hypothetical protein FA15DRAFT_660596 [Coprinopsis marcescibilis]|uniref:Uncharacterized protein n=1 Tax=Coprinopsis marcescibilis TaxID=230819 RepID=A0A5C3KEP9_COPMA|nr:hypothetical protein FA15DRAFT_660596 [Coprinopsis marcescibilis]